jgi:hypothetical protein
MELSNEKSLQFVEDYRQYKILWNSRDKEYKINRKKRDVLALLAEKYCASVTDVKTKNKTHRTLFHHEHKKYAKTRWNGRRFFQEMVRLPVTQIYFGCGHTERRLFDWKGELAETLY